MKIHAMTMLASAVLAAAVALPAQAVGIAAIPGFQGVRVWEATSTPSNPDIADFAAGDARLVATLPGAALSQAGRDFGFFNGNEPLLCPSPASGSACWQG